MIQHFCSLQERELVTKTMKILVGNAAESHGISSDVLEKRKAIKRWDCYEDAVDYLIENCQDHLNLPKVCAAYFDLKTTSVILQQSSF